MFSQLPSSPLQNNSVLSSPTYCIHQSPFNTFHSPKLFFIINILFICNEITDLLQTPPLSFPYISLHHMPVSFILTTQPIQTSVSSYLISSSPMSHKVYFCHYLSQCCAIYLTLQLTLLSFTTGVFMYQLYSRTPTSVTSYLLSLINGHKAT